MRYTFDMPRNRAWQEVRRKGMIVRAVICGIVALATVVLILIFG
jgi:hypothetical protein